MQSALSPPLQRTWRFARGSLAKPIPGLRLYIHPDRDGSQAMLETLVVATAVGSTFLAVFLVTLVAGLDYIDRH